MTYLMPLYDIPRWGFAPALCWGGFTFVLLIRFFGYVLFAVELVIVWICVNHRTTGTSPPEFGFGTNAEYSCLLSAKFLCQRMTPVAAHITVIVTSVADDGPLMCCCCIFYFSRPAPQQFAPVTVFQCVVARALFFSSQVTMNFDWLWFEFDLRMSIFLRFFESWFWTRRPFLINVVICRAYNVIGRFPSVRRMFCTVYNALSAAKLTFIL